MENKNRIFPRRDQKGLSSGRVFGFLQADGGRPLPELEEPVPRDDVASAALAVDSIFVKAMRFTISICTFNRADVLSRSILAARAQTFTSDQFEILVVDNNSTDNTRELVQKHAAEISALRMVQEANQGLSHARNRALQEARGEFIVYVDDDAELTPGYLAALDRLFREEENVGAAGGPIEVRWLDRVPSWYEPEIDRFFNSLYIASFRMALRYPRILFGTNMAFPTAFLRELGGFNTALGRIGTKLLASEDGEIMLRIERKSGRRVFWDPQLRVFHLIHPSRLSKEYLERKAYWDGRSIYKLEKLYPGTSRIRHSMFILAGHWGRKILGLSANSLAEKLAYLCEKGYLSEWLRPSS